MLKITEYHLMYGTLTTFLGPGMEACFRSYSHLLDLCLAISLDFCLFDTFSHLWHFSSMNPWPAFHDVTIDILIHDDDVM